MRDFLTEPMIADRQRQMIGIALAMGALLATAFALSACSTSIADLPVGSAADAPAPHEPGSYLPVHDLPPDRDEAVISPAERAKIQSELVKARDQQAAVTAAQTPPPAPAKNASPPKQSPHAKLPPAESHAEE
jgi:hypothetical protein